MAMQCANPSCLFDGNSLDAVTCGECGKPLVRRFLWAVGNRVDQIGPGTLVGDRYHVTAPYIWLDTRPSKPPEAPAELPASVLPYLKLFPYRLHVPTIYGFAVWESTAVLLLENAPLDALGKPLPMLDRSLASATPIRQVYWLWQMLELWVPLKEVGVASSVLVEENLRADGWRLRLRSLYGDAQSGDEVPTLRDLALLWQTWTQSMEPSVTRSLQHVIQHMLAGDDDPAKVRAIAINLNQLLLEQAAQQPLRLRLAAATSPGPHHTLNEDACFPQPGRDPSTSEAFVLPHLAMVCDGIGGHSGGEIASQLAVRSMQIQIRAMLADVAEETNLLTPDIVTQQLESIVRIVNNTISTQNDTQGREARERMGTTLVMALQLPQKMKTDQGWSNAHELYLVHMGDSRAYWLTQHACHALTVDDDIAGREVRLGRGLYRDVLRRPEGGALTQALGTRDGMAIYPTVQRFIVEEDGLLMLCSDGVSDNELVEQHWPDLMRSLYRGKMTLEQCAQAWVELANQRNSHDNASVVMVQCQVSDRTQFIDPSVGAIQLSMPEMTPTSRELLYDQAPSIDSPTRKQRRSPIRGLSPVKLATVSILAGMLMVGLAGLVIWWGVNPDSFQRFWRGDADSEQTSP
ncbi:PP2C family protein-serine/threonine phosphatase [Leptolyngbya sp. AN02str]|uniref:PP2C family protein-serine/threonine phosphatase n=1 Tax=Leptolyngbya sp. AN02str TaxID=3423363 RepID=UPI003D321FBB